VRIRRRLAPRNRVPLAAGFLLLAAACASTQTGLLRLGKPAPDVTALDQNGRPVRLRDLRGKTVVVYFFPSADSPDAEMEAEAFQASYRKYRDAEAEIVGVSPDRPASLRTLSEKHRVRFRLLSDSDQKVALAFGIPVANGKPKRITFLLDRHGDVRRVWNRVQPSGHAEEVLAAVNSLVAGYTDLD
jgi:peroxiredoxin Q/BCP